MNGPGEIKKDGWLAAAALTSWGALMLMLPRLPAEIPMHWGIDGSIDRWGSKWNLAWLGLLPFGIWLLITFLPAIDPRKENYPRFGRSYRMIRVVIVLLMMAISWISAVAGLKEDIDTALLVMLLMGVVFITIGNLLTRIRPNWFTGIRSPWTLADPVIWRKTHRLGGYLMVSAGICFIGCAFFVRSNARFWIPISLLLAGVVLDYVYSAILWKKLHGDEPVPKPAAGRPDGE